MPPSNSGSKSTAKSAGGSKSTAKRILQPQTSDETPGKSKKRSRRKIWTCGRCSVSSKASTCITIVQGRAIQQVGCAFACFRVHTHRCKHISVLSEQLWFWRDQLGDTTHGDLIRARCMARCPFRNAMCCEIMVVVAELRCNITTVACSSQRIPSTVASMQCVAWAVFMLVSYVRQRIASLLVCHTYLVGKDESAWGITETTPSGESVPSGPACYA